MIELAEYPGIQLTLAKGKHGSREDGMCAMEAVALLAGEPHTDHPGCACPVITAVSIRLNDLLPSDAAREKVFSGLLCSIIGSRGSPLLTVKRAQACATFADECAKSAAAAKSAESESESEWAEWAAKAAKSAEWAAESAAKSAESAWAAQSAEWAAKSAEWAAKSAEKSAEWAAESLMQLLSTLLEVTE